MSSSHTITRGFSIAGGMAVPAWKVTTAGYGIGTAVDIDYGLLGFLCPARRLEAITLSIRLDFRTPSIPLDVERPGE